MRICIYGAGAIGGHLAARYAAAGMDVSVIARGPHLAAIKADGLTLETAQGTTTHRLRASADPAELGEQDAVIVAVKATAIATMAEGLKPLMRPHTPIVFALNGRDTRHRRPNRSGGGTCQRDRLRGELGQHGGGTRRDPQRHAQQPLHHG
jgi:ketopantoate reductase